MFNTHVRSRGRALTLSLLVSALAAWLPVGVMAKSASHDTKAKAAQTGHEKSVKADKQDKREKSAGHATKESAKSTRSAKVDRIDKSEKAERGARAHVTAERGAKGHGREVIERVAERATTKSGKAARLAAEVAAPRRLSKAERLAEARQARLEELRERRAERAEALAHAREMREARLARDAREAREARQAQVAAAAPMIRTAVASGRPSMGQIYGLHDTRDALELKSSVALVVDQDTSEVLFGKNPEAVLPIASLTKLMTAVVVVEAHQSLDDMMEITAEDIDTEKGSRSRLVVGTQLTRGEMLHLALMSSENRAAHALGRYYPGGLWAAVQAMNRKALSLGMSSTRYIEPTGLSSENQSSAADLAKLVKAAYQYPLIRELSTSSERQVWTGSKTLQFHTTNGLVRNPSWQIGLQKTGYISEAGRCLVMQAQLAGRRLIMVFLDSAGKYSRIGDAERVRRWLEGGDAAPLISSLPAPTRVSVPAGVEVARPATTVPAL